MEDSFLVALHGSHQPAIGGGYQIVRVSKDSGKQAVFMDGFLAADGKRPARPVYVLQKDANSFFVTDDHAGRLYYIFAAE